MSSSAAAAIVTSTVLGPALADLAASGVLRESVGAAHHARHVTARFVSSLTLADITAVRVLLVAVVAVHVADGRAGDATGDDLVERLDGRATEAGGTSLLVQLVAGRAGVWALDRRAVDRSWVWVTGAQRAVSDVIGHETERAGLPATVRWTTSSRPRSSFAIASAN